MDSGMMANISLLSNVRLTGLNPLNINKHDLVHRSTARSYLGTINQHDHVLRSNAWSFFSFRTTNQHDHVLRSNAWSCFLFRHEAGWSRLCLWAGHFTQSFPVLIMYAFVHCSLLFSLCTRPDMVSSLTSKLNHMA